MVDLLPQHACAADRPVKHRLVQHYPQVERVILSKQRLAGHSDVHPTVQFCLGDVRPALEDHLAGIVVDLKQSRNDLTLVCADLRSGRLQTHICAGQHRAVQMPPAFLPRLTGHLDQALRGRAGHTVNFEHVAYVRRRGSGVSGLDPGDLR